MPLSPPSSPPTAGRKPRRPQGRSSMDVIEYATSLLRKLPPRAWFAFYGPGIPFILGMLLFWSEMCRAPDAHQRLVPYALVLALLYIVMKCGHAAFGDQLLSLLRRDPERPPRLRPSQWLRLAASQSLLHATMPWLTLLASIPVFPIPWVYAFYHNASVLACGHFRTHGSFSSLASRSLRAAYHAPRSNIAILLTLSLVSFLVWLNAMILTLLIPQLAGILTGIDFAMNLSPEAMLNTTLVATATGTAWLVVSPLFHAAYAVRCFESDSSKSGEDLLAALRSLRMPATTLACLLCLIQPARAADTTPPPPAPEQVTRLDHALDETLDRAEFRWRMPREAIPEDQMGWLERTMRDFTNWLAAAIKSIAELIGDFIRWLTENDRKDPYSGDDGGSWLSDPANARVLLLLLLLGLFTALAILLIRWLAARREIPTVAATSTPVIDLHDESILATDLPEDEWLRLANERIAAGDTRLALRALFLGTLSRLGNRGLLSIAPGKTNGMYLRELHRRPQAHETLRSAFSLSVRLFERCWYGTHTASTAILDEARTHHETISQDARTEHA